MNDKICHCFFVSHPIRRIYIWSINIQIDFIKFPIQLINTINGKITNFQWCLEPNLISAKKLIKKLFDNFIYFIINHDFYVNTLWIYYTLFTSVFRRNKVDCHCQLSFPWVKFFEIICLSSMVSFLQGTLWLIGFYFYHHYFHIWYNCC